GLFSVGWLSFTTFHATLMIGGFKQAFGWGALALLGFYAIFFAVGIGMAIAGANAASREEIVLDGYDLTVTKTLAGWIRKKTHRLGPDSIAEISTTTPTTMNNRNSRPVPCIALNDAEGNAVTLGLGGTDAMRAANIERINAYLAAQS
ncbi:MAG: hypothetical protein ABL962_16055, partial [Fimbriimonadaceae bacterium]